MENKIIKSNELIAEFIGGINEMPKGYILFCCIPDKLCEKTHFFTPNDMQFHSSWDWLMPVVQKILSSDMYFEMDNFKSPIVGTAKISHVKTSLMSANILTIHEAVIEFIEYYNKNKKS